MQGDVSDYNAMDVMFGNKLPHMGLMGHATSGFIDPGLDYSSLNYPQMQVSPTVCTKNTMLGECEFVQENTYVVNHTS